MLAASEISSRLCGQRNPIVKLVEGHILLNVFSELNPAIAHAGDAQELVRIEDHNLVIVGLVNEDVVHR